MATNAEVSTKTPTKAHYELNQTCVDRFFWAYLHKDTLRYETKDWSTFRKYSESYCHKAMDIFRDAYEKLARHIEYLTKKEVFSISKEGIIEFTDNSKMRIC